MTALRLAVAGTGLIGRTHVELIRCSTECELVAVADPLPPGADYARGLGVTWHSSLAELLNQAQPDGVMVATRNALHAANAIECIDRGVPVPVEKPIADTVAEAERIAAAGERAGVAVLVGHHRRPQPDHRPRARSCRAAGSVASPRSPLSSPS